MKLIHRKNFLSIICISFTCVVCGKLLIEKIAGVTDAYYTENIFTCLAVSTLATGILALHYYLRKIPLLPLIIGQYIVFLAIIFACMRIEGLFVDFAPGSYFEMFRSVTIPYVIGAAVYYISFFLQVKNANSMIDDLKLRDADKSS